MSVTKIITAVTLIVAQGLTTAQYRQAVEEEIISTYMYSQQRKLRTAGDGRAK